MKPGICNEERYAEKKERHASAALSMTFFPEVQTMNKLKSLSKFPL